MTARTRADLATATRIVVKVGSSSISGESSWRIPVIVEALAAAHARGAEVVLVSSGAIASGIPFLRLDARPTDLATQQAAAAVGQNILVYRYQEALRPFDIVAGQVLLTTGDLENPTSRSNARRAMERLLGLRTLPIVNENDTVATQEIRFGDNDRLGALVAQLIEADALVLLSDIESLYTRPPSDPGAEPNRRRRPRCGPLRAGVRCDRGQQRRHRGSGHEGLRCRLAAASGIGVLVTSADLVAQALAGADIGTWFEPATS
ncbi:glutamate 5-kinase [Microbacterium sp. NRRL B-14842]|uniref:glutamate 5-kinase n=1 Tax=Microbacterium sp. NRRL B-14842 TaxID=3162881 RepID=UPI003D28B305